MELRSIKGQSKILPSDVKSRDRGRVAKGTDDCLCVCVCVCVWAHLMSQCHSNAWPHLQDIPLNTVGYHVMLPSLQQSTRWTDSSYQLALIRSKHIQYLKRHLVWCGVERERENEGQTGSRTDGQTDRRTQMQAGH